MRKSAEREGPKQWALRLSLAPVTAEPSFHLRPRNMQKVRLIRLIGSQNCGTIGGIFLY